MKILLTGGSGRLGRELQRHSKFVCPSHEEMDITKPIANPSTYDMVIHSAAFTNGGRAEKDRIECFNTNVVGTLNLVTAFTCPFVYISSEYVVNGKGWYARTKRMGEEIVETHPNHLIIRTLFKPRPYPYETAYIDQWTRGDYVDVIGMIIFNYIRFWEYESVTVHLGTKRKTLFELAQKTRPDVRPISVRDIRHVEVPSDYM